MDRDKVKELLYEKYIAPTRDKTTRYIGVEIEMPIVNLSKQAVDFAVVHALTRSFKDAFHFNTAVIDENREICSLIHFNTDDILSYDCSYNNLELSFGKEMDLNVVAARFAQYYSYINTVFAKNNYTLTGMGINPYRKYNHLDPIPNGRYRMLYHHLSSYARYRIPMFFHPWPNYGMFSSASQVQLDVRYEDLIETIRSFSLLEPIKAVLFANSVLTEEWEDLLCCRDMLWENSTQGINPHNIGMFEEIPENIDELLEYIASTSMYCTQQDGKYINFEPIQVTDYFNRHSVKGEYYSDGAYHEIEFAPRVEDLAYLRSFKFEDLTFRGTIEFRSVCCQPIRDVMSVAAFHLGLIGKSRELNELFERDQVLFHHGYNASELRKLLNRREWPEFIDRTKLRGLLFEILNLAETGLKERGQNEEIFLRPIFQRAENLENPARKLLAKLSAGESAEEIILDYGTL